MNFDTVIIGGGLAGLTCGIALQKQGNRCVIINNGQSALDFSSGSMDLLSRLPNGEEVESLAKSFEKLTALLPQHPYAILGREQVFEKVAQFERLAKELDLGLEGTMQANHDRVTPLGGLRPTWLSANSVPVSQKGEKFPYDSIAVLGIEGFHDFQPNLLVENLKQQAEFAHCEFVVGYLNIPELDQLRERSREFRSVNIAQLLEQKLKFSDLVRELKQEAKGKSAVFIPACFGLDSQAFLHELRQATGLALFEVPTIPPSLLGIRQHKKLRHHFESLGGLMLNGDRALRAEFDGNRVTKIFTQLHQEQAISADNFVLASGSFFSNGLKAEFERVFEPLFGADILEQGDFKATDRLSWTHSRFSQPQPYQSAGIVINEKCQVRKSGEFLQNVYATGSVIGGYNAIELGCGSGVAVATALTIAQQLGGQ